MATVHKNEFERLNPLTGVFGDQARRLLRLKKPARRRRRGAGGVLGLVGAGSQCAARGAEQGGR